jgi:murein DD-endopeptidase MepM/ murein hydrolase activator NlpD
VAHAPNRGSNGGPPGIYHQVKPGENLYRIARAYGIAPEALAADNGIADPRQLHVGQRLFIPGADDALPIPDPSLDGAALEKREVGVTPAAHRPRSGCEGSHCLSWPIRGVIYARFGMKTGEGAGGHEGIDLAAPEGTPIAAAAAGQVLYAGDQKGYGTLVIIQHPDGRITLYAHNQVNLVKEGQKVEQGQIIARVGISGRTTGPHVHFEVRKDTRPIDPMPLLPDPGGPRPPESPMQSLASKR